MQRVAPLDFDYITERGRESIGKTSSESKNRWNAATYKRYTVSLRQDEDSEIINFLEKAKKQNQKIVTQIFREGYNQIIKEGK